MYVRALDTHSNGERSEATWLLVIRDICYLFRNIGLQLGSVRHSGWPDSFWKWSSSSYSVTIAYGRNEWYTCAHARADTFAHARANAFADAFADARANACSDANSFANACANACADTSTYAFTHRSADANAHSRGIARH